MIIRRVVYGLGHVGLATLFLILAASLVLSQIVPAQAATWYVQAGSSGGGGTSWATAFATVQEGLNAAASGDVVEVGGGLYAEALQSVRAGVTVAGSTAAGHNAQVVIRAGDGQEALRVGHQTVWKGLTFDGSANTNTSTTLAVVHITAGSPLFEACAIGPGLRLLIVGPGGAAFSRCTIQEARLGNRVYTKVVDVSAGNSPVTFDYCLFGDMEYGSIYVNSASQVDFNNCLLAGFAADILYVPPGVVVSGGIHLTNCLALGNGFAATALVENASTTAPVTLTNCLMQDKSPVEMTGTRYVGDVTEVSPLVPGSPQLTHARRAALLNLGIDDAANASFATQVAALANSSGIKITLALDAADATSQDWADAQMVVNGGNEVAGHSSRHVYLPETKLMTLRYAGQGTGATVTVTSSGTMATTLDVAATGDPAATFSLDLADSATDTIGKVCDVINAKAGFTCGVISIAGTTYTSARVLSRDLNAVSGVSIQGVTATLLRNDAQFFADEITAPKILIESELTAPGSATPYACTSFVYPFLGTDAAVLAATAAAGYTAARSGYDGSYAMGGLYAGTTPGDYDTLDIWAVKPGDVFGRNLDAATLARRVSAFLEWAKFTGAAVSLFSHGANEYDLTEWSALLALIAADDQIQTATLAGIRQYVAQNAQSQSGSTFVRTVWPSVADYRPIPASPLLLAGAAYSTAKTDFGGTVVAAGTLPSVGLYQGASLNPARAMPAIDLLLLLQ
ncbi:hypothetical protein [Desulfovibrio sp. DV]|uniref:hypothetical protein n=1 Tax=Desulfovibrio sp. DV TaxID=1844708 RepID=UPI00094BA9A3|nr:hypothetical protein [Desulfovibrio sp. DV]